MPKRLLKFSLYGLLAIVLLVAALLVYWLLPVLHDPTDDYSAADTTVASAIAGRRWRQARHQFTEFILTSRSGIRVPVTIARPLGDHPHPPAVILLAGQGTGRDACGLIETDLPLLCVALSYPYEGEARLNDLNMLWNVREVQNAVVHTPPAVLLTLDYISGRADLSPGRIELVGVSLGAFLASVPAAMDTRIDRLWLIHGAADPATVLSYRLKDRFRSPWLRRWLGRGLSVLVAGPYLKPERWVGKVAPRPVIIVNARDEQAFPPQTVERLHRAAAEPREIIWTAGGHVMPGKQTVVHQLNTIVIDRINRELKKPD
jgi:hypothetical protein